MEGLDTICSMYDPVTEQMDCVLDDPPLTANDWYNGQLTLDSSAWNAPQTFDLSFAKPVNCAPPPENLCVIRDVQCTSETSISFLVVVLDPQV